MQEKDFEEEQETRAKGRDKILQQIGISTYKILLNDLNLPTWKEQEEAYKLFEKV